MEALAQYEADLANYNHNMAVWHSMTDAEKAAAHVSAEDSSVSSYSGFVGFVIGALVWYRLAHERELDFLYGLGILILSVVVFTVIKPIRVLVGRLTRMLVHAIGYFIGIWIIGAIISIWSPLIKDNAAMLTVGLVGAVILISAILEISGGHHASGEPTMPSKPSP